jgi:protease I
VIEQQLSNMRVAILASDGFEESELIEPRKALDDAGAETKVISLNQGTIQGMKHEKKAGTVKVDATLHESNPDDFDAILLPGGALNADALRVDPKAQEFVRTMDHAQKPVAVICHAPWLLVSAGLVNGRSLTSYYTIQDDIRNAGGRWTDEEVVRDNNWISSRQPQDIPAFNKAMVSLFSDCKAMAAGAGQGSSYSGSDSESRGGHSTGRSARTISLYDCAIPR